MVPFASLFLPHGFTLVPSTVNYSKLEMEEACSSETSVDFQYTKRRYIPDDRTLHCYKLAEWFLQRLSDLQSVNIFAKQEATHKTLLREDVARY
jgi:hypothetical protein